jgi:hypothetical protein
MSPAISARAAQQANSSTRSRAGTPTWTSRESAAPAALLPLEYKLEPARGRFTGPGPDRTGPGPDRTGPDRPGPNRPCENRRQQRLWWRPRPRRTPRRTRGDPPCPPASANARPTDVRRPEGPAGRPAALPHGTAAGPSVGIVHGRGADAGPARPGP